MATQRTIVIQTGDEKWVCQFMDELKMLTGLVEEAFETNTNILLSPTLRRLIRDHARKVESMRSKVHNLVCVDKWNDIV